MIVWSMPYPMATNAAGDKARGRAALHAFDLSIRQQAQANQETCYDVAPLCKARRWTGAAGPIFNSPQETSWPACKKCLETYQKKLDEFG